MKLKTIYILVFLVSGQFISAQNSLKNLIDSYNDHSVPYMQIDELSKQENIVLLDARELKEYETSHIDKALYVGYDNFDITNCTKNVSDKNQKIVVYCSLGIRSEVVAKKIKEAGYTNVYNLYGGIFEWKNQGCSVVNSEGNETDKVHAFSIDWGKWLVKGEKVYE